MKVNLYIGLWTLKMKCTQHGLYEQAAFKNRRVRPGSGFFSAARLPPLAALMRATLIGVFRETHVVML